MMIASTSLLVFFLTLVFPSDEQCLNDYQNLQPFLNKTYQLFYSEDDHYNTVLQTIGVSPTQRSVAIFDKPFLELDKIGDEYVLSVTSAQISSVEKFRLPGEWMSHTTWDGRSVNTLFCSAQNTLWQWEVGVDDVTITWSFYPEEVRCNMFLKGGTGVTCLRVYRAVDNSKLIKVIKNNNGLARDSERSNSVR